MNLDDLRKAKGATDDQLRRALEELTFRQKRQEQALHEEHIRHNDFMFGHNAIMAFIGGQVAAIRELLGEAPNE